MDQLSSADAAFLELEQGNIYMHTGALTIIDPSEAPDFNFAALRKLLKERIVEAPRFTAKLREVPYGLDWPYLEYDPDFSIDNHLRRIGVASPGGPRELCDLVGLLMSQPLDRSLPLWEMWFVEGLEEGRVAMIAKTHHCLVDGVSGSALGALLADLQPDPGPRPKPKRPVHEQKSDFEITVRGLRKTFAGPVAVARLLGKAAENAPTIVRYMRGDDAPERAAEMPQLPFNAEISPRRAFAYARLPLNDIKTLKKRCDVKVNDVVIAVCAGALRRYLESIGEMPKTPVICAMPISIRASGDESLGNQISNVTVSMATHIDDPLDRLQAIHDGTMHAKEMTRAMGVADIVAQSEALPATLVSLGMRAALRLGEGAPIAANTIVSNVPGPPFPLYSAGAKLVANYPIAPLMPGMGLNLTVMSYVDAIDFGVAVDPALIPDPWLLADAFAPALAELVDAIDARDARIAREEARALAAAKAPKAKASSRPSPTGAPSFSLGHPAPGKPGSAKPAGGKVASASKPASAKPKSVPAAKAAPATKAPRASQPARTAKTGAKADSAAPAGDAAATKPDES